MTTDYHDYFLSRISQEDPLAGNAKFADLQQASTDKIAELTQRKATQLAQEKANANSFVGQLGMDPEGIAGRVVNTGANLYQGTMRVAGSVLSAAPTALAAANQANLSEDDIAALGRHEKGQSTPADLERINRKVAPIVAPTPGMPRELAQAHANERAQVMADLNPNAPTPLSIWSEMNKARDISRTIVAAADKSSAVQADAQNSFNADLTTTFTDNAPQIAKGWEDLKNGSKLGGSADVVVGVAKLLYGATADVLSNKQATFEYMVQNAPQLFVGLAGKTGAMAQMVDNVSSAADNYNEGIQTYQAAHGGALPPEDQRQRMAFMVAAHAGAETFGDKIGLAATKLGGQAAQDVSRAGFKSALKGTAAAAAEGVLSEAPTEAFQQYAEGEMKGKAATGAEIFAAGVIGGASGAGLSGGGHAVHELAKSGQPSEAKQATVDHSKVQDAAIASGDVSKLTNPVEAIAALTGHSQKADTTPEQKQANLVKASEIVSALETQHEAAQQEAKTSTVAGVKELIAERQAQLADPETAKDPAKVALLNKSLDLAQADLTDLEASKDQKAVETTVQKKLDGITQQLKDANTAKDNLELLVRPPASIDADIALVSTPSQEVANDTLTAGVAPRATAAGGVSKEQTAAADRIITLAMTAPGRLDTAVVAKLAADTSNALTAPQRTYLSAFVRAQQSNPTLTSSKVAEDIYAGKHGNKGVVQYRGAMGKALAAGNQKVADTEMSGISQFAQAHQDKAAAAAQAIKLGLGTSILKEDSQWVVGKPGVAVTAEQHKAGGRTITSGRLALDIKNEAQALTDVASELQAAYDLKFTTPTKKANDVKNVSQQGTGSKTKGEGTADQAAKPAGNDTAVESPRATDVQSTGVVGASVVEADGVKPTELTEKIVNTEEPLGSSVNTKSTETTGETTGEVKSTTELTPSEPTQPAGTLEVMATKSPEGTPFNLRNLIADYFTQTAGNDSDTSLRPLVAVKDFLSQMTKETALESLSIPKLNVKQIAVLETFKSTALAWQSTIQSNLSLKKSTAFRYDDMTQFFLKDTENGPALEENVKTGMAYAGFSWIAENASRSRFNTPEEINLILLRDEDHPVSKLEQAVLGDVGTRQNVVFNALGQRAVQALGFKVAKNAPKDLLPKLESALGAHIGKMLMDEGILERVTVPGSVMKKLTGKENTNENVEFQFLRIATATDGKLNAGATKIMEATRGTQGILDKVFSVEAGLKEPSLAPIPFTQTRTKNTNQGVPSKLAAVMEHENSVASYVRQDMWQLVNQLDEATMMEISGAEHLEGKHAANIPSLEATNDGLARELSRFKDFVGGMADQTAGMFFEHTVWKQQRVGIATNAVNPQTSKIHRHMLFRQSWETKIDRNNGKEMQNFQLRVAEGLGVKTDKQGNGKSMGKYNEKVANPVIQDAVAVLVQMLEGQDMTPAKEKILLAGVKAGGEKMHSLDALMALAQSQYSKDDVFTTHLMGEVDGVTNGPMLSHLLMGAANSVPELFKLLNRGGFYEQGNEHNQYNLWREAAGHFDLYENTALHMTQAVQTYINNGVDLGKGRVMGGAQVNATVQSIYAFTGPLELKGVVQKEGRNIIKTPLTAMVFGSSVGSAVESMANKFVESIYAGIEDLAAGKGDRVEMIGHINTLLGSSSISSNASIEQLMKKEFTTDQVDRLKRSFKNTVGKAVAETMQQDFESFISQRQQFNHAAQMTFTLYNATYTGLRDQMIKELIESGEIAVNSKGSPLHDLTAQQENKLRKQLSDLAPIMHTMMSKDSGQLNAGLYISKSGKSLSTKTTYEGSIKFGTKFSDNGAASTSTRGFETVETAPGVSMAPMSVHSTDSAIMHNSIGQTEVLNVHDAKGVGVAGFQQAAQSLNQSTWNAMLNYSPAGEMFAALSRTVVGLSALAQKGDLPPAVMTNVANALQAFADKNDMDKATVLRQMVQGARTMATHADNIKLEALSQMQAIDQYALQGGNYEVKDKDRAEAAARRAELPTALTKEETEAITQLESLLKVEATEKLIKQEKDIEEDSPTAVSPFGVLGKPTAKSDPELVAFFKENPKATAKQVVHFLYRKLSADTTAVNRDFNLKLLKVLSKTVNPSLTVNLVTAETQEADVLNAHGEPTLGWYTHKGVDEAIYITGNDFTHSNIQVEVLLHELTHAATAYRLTTTAGKVQLAELNTLLDQVRKYTKDNSITKFDAALANVDELVAYGMTSQPFQQLLSEVQMAPAANTPLSNALQKFIGVLANLLGFKDSASAKGLGVLLTNVSALFEQGANEKASLESRTMGMAASVNTYNTLDIHEALADGSLTEEFDNHLRSLLGGIVDKLHGPFGAFKESLMKNQAVDAIDAWSKALKTGVAPFASESMAHIATSPQVAHAMEQVEATIRAALTANESQTKMVYSELYKLYTEAENLVTVKDLDQGDPVAAQNLHDFLFKLDKTSGDRSDYLARFAALGLAHPLVNQALKTATERTARKAADAKTILERLEIAFENILRFFQSKVTHTYQGQPADEKLTALVGQLVDIEAKKRNTLDKRDKATNYLEPLEANIKKFTDAVSTKVEAVAGSNYVRNHKSAYVKAAGGLVGTIAGGRVDLFMEGLYKLRAQNFKERFGVVASLMQAYKGQNIVFQGLIRMTKLLEGDRQDKITGWAKSSLEAFADNGKGLIGKSDKNVAARASITSVLMRTGAHNLMGDFSLKDIEKLLADKTARDAAITSFEHQLDVHGKFANYYRNQANALGYQKAVGVARTKFVNQNAHLISRLAGTGQESRVSTTQAEQAEATLKVLITLYALRYSNDKARTAAAGVLHNENQRTDGNGIEFTLKLHQRLETESLERLFDGNPALMIHGYTSEIYDPNVTIQTANALEGQDLIDQGYTKGAAVPLDPADADRDVKHLYVLKDGGLPRFVSGVISNRGMQAKGTTIHNGYLNTYNQTGIANAAQNAALVQDRQAAIADMFRSGPVADLSKAKGNYMMPVFNGSGAVVNWRYSMAESTKDTVMNRNNRFDKVLGTIAGSIYDKETSREQNMTAVKALHDQYQADYKKNPEQYMVVSSKSDDPEMREIWNLLPDNTRKDVRSVWGYNGMMVRVDNLDIMFGYRKLTVGTVFQKANEERDARKAAGERDNVMALKSIDAWQKLIVMAFENALKVSGLVQGMDQAQATTHSKKAKTYAVRGEHIWQAMVSEAKDIIVVKSGVVMMGNIKSNLWLLGMSGVPLLDALQHHLVAWKGAVSWKKDSDDLEHLKRLRDAGYTQGKATEIDRKILRLEDALARNPVRGLVEAGLMPTIVEDINPEDDLYSYKSHLVRKVESVTDKMNPTLVRAAKTAYLAHDTKIYQTMHQVTQLSDFMARYTLYQHLTNRKVDPLSEQDATQKVSEAFINYDIAMHRNLQYTDDMGITMFTKYFLGIQKVLADTLKENPARVLTGVLLAKFLGLGPTVLDGSMWEHIGNNPIKAGPFELFDSFGNLPVVSAPLSLFKMMTGPATP